MTRSGSDGLHGAAFYYNRNSGTGANDAVDKAAGIPRPVSVLQQFGGSLSGPIVPHHTWFFADREQQKQKNLIPVVNPAFADVSQSEEVGTSLYIAVCKYRAGFITRRVSFDAAGLGCEHGI